MKSLKKYLPDLVAVVLFAVISFVYLCRPTSTVAYSTVMTRRQDVEQAWSKSNI